MEVEMNYSFPKSFVCGASTLVLMMLSACGEAEHDAAREAAEMAAPDATTAGQQNTQNTQNTNPSALPDIAVTLPRMAYVFDYAFRLPGEEIAAVQIRHADMCEAMGPTQCQIVGMTSTGGEDGENAGGVLQLAVATDRARGFVGELSAIAEGFHGEQVSARITGEDLSKQLVDTEAHLRSRTQLRDRLQDVLATRRGTVEELVEAERNVAAINQEIDQARSWMAEMQGRVAMSRVNLTYESATPVGGDFLAPVNKALGSIGAILGVLAAVLIVLGAIAGPFVLGALGLRHWQKRKAGVAEG
jgi:hypothetical protein